MSITSVKARLGVICPLMKQWTAQDREPTELTQKLRRLHRDSAGTDPVT
jgi:hypothetical protein